MFVKVDTVINQNQTATGITLNITQIVLMNGPILLMSNGTEVVLTSNSMFEVEQKMFPTKQVKSTEPKKELLELFENLHKLTGGKGKPVFSLQREKKLTELLTKHRMTPELLVKAAINIGKDDFLQGRDPNNQSKKRYGDIDYLLRPDKAAKWSEDQEQKKKPGMF